MKSTTRTWSCGVLLLLSLSLAISTSPSWAQQDPGDPGPLAVTRAEYDYGDRAFLFQDDPSFPTEVRAVVHYPTDLSGGPFPLVIFLHGWHPTCYQGGSSFREWPCPSPHQPIPSYIGYDYAAQILASYGYIVVSISANGVNARDTAFFDVGMLWRAQLIQRHLDQWNTFNTTGADPFGKLFVGEVDLNNVGTMGHSRGGEGVARHYVYNRDLGSPYNVRAVLPLAPVNFSREVLDNTAIMVVLPYCDGDVADLQGAHYFDDARYIAGDPTNKHYILVMGGNHAFSNTIWTPGGWPAATWDDWFAFEDLGGSNPWCGAFSGNHRLTPAQQRGMGRAYFTAFFRTYLGGETDFLPILKGDAPPPPSALTTEILATYHPKDDPASRLDVNRLLIGDNLAIDTLGGDVTQIGLTPYDLCGGEFPQPQHCLPTPPQQPKRQPHTVPSARSSRRGLSQLRFGWDGTDAVYQNDLPAGTGDVSGYAALQFRASVNFVDTRNPAGVPQDVSVTLVDGAGNTSTVLASDFSGALFYPPGDDGRITLAVPKIVLNTVRLPLAAFKGVDLTDIGSILFQFDQTSQGALLISDIAFAD